jgi:hypothetical protein
MSTEFWFLILTGIVSEIWKHSWFINIFIAFGKTAVYPLHEFDSKGLNSLEFPNTLDFFFNNQKSFNHNFDVETNMKISIRMKCARMVKQTSFHIYD